MKSPQLEEAEQEGPADLPEFEFDNGRASATFHNNNNNSNDNYYYCAAFSPSSSAPADELFFEGHLLPLLRPPALPEKSGYGDSSFFNSTAIGSSMVNSPSCSVATTATKEVQPINLAARIDEASSSKPSSLSASSSSSFMNWKCIMQKIKASAPIAVSRLPRFSSQERNPRAGRNALEWGRQNPSRNQNQKQKQKRRTFPVSPDHMTSGERSSSFPPTGIRRQSDADGSRRKSKLPWYAKIFSVHASANSAGSGSLSRPEALIPSTRTAITGSSVASGGGTAASGSKTSFSSPFSLSSSTNSSTSTSSLSSGSWEPKRPSISSWDCNHISTRLVAVPSSCPVSTKSSPNNSGLLYCSAVMSKNPSFCHSNMQHELENAIQGAIAYCKQSQSLSNDNGNNNRNNNNNYYLPPMDLPDQSARCSI